MNAKNPGEGLRIIWSGITVAFTGAMILLGYFFLAFIGLVLILATAGLYWLLSWGGAEEYLNNAEEQCTNKNCDLWSCNKKHYV